LPKQKNQTFIKKAMFTQLKFLIFGSVVLSSVYEIFLASDSTYKAFHNSRPRENEETREGIRMCNFKENKISLETYSRKDNLKLTNQKPAPSRYVCHIFTLLGFNKKAIFLK
jgi:hypothetical protein